MHALWYPRHVWLRLSGSQLCSLESSQHHVPAFSVPDLQINSHFIQTIKLSFISRRFLWRQTSRGPHMHSTPFFFFPSTMFVPWNNPQQRWYQWHRLESVSRGVQWGAYVHVKPVRQTDLAEQSTVFPEALISVNAVGNFVERFLSVSVSCFLVNACQQMSRWR